MKLTNLHQNMRDGIITTSRELFARYGFKKTAMEDIARALGKAKNTIYYYFKDKDELFHAVAEVEIEKGKEELMKVAVMQVPAREKISAYIMTRMSVMQALANYYTALADEYFENYGLIEKIRTGIDREELSIIGKILKDGIQQNLFNIKKVDITAANIHKILKGLEHSYFKEKDIRNLKQEIDNLTAILLDGLLKR